MPKANSGTFNWPGGKTTLAPWIISHIPDHHLYVEPFGGAASVLVPKDRSPVEVYNDINRHCVEFFRAVKYHADELAGWVDATPYSRELFEEWAQEFIDDDLPDDTVERAGRFLYVQTASFGGLPPESRSPCWSVRKVDNKPQDCQSKRWARAPDQIEWLKDRFKKVQIEHLDYLELLDKYDDPEAFMYFDPPYLDAERNYYNLSEPFNHSEFVSRLHDLDCHWIVSYDKLPDGLGQYRIESRERSWTMNEVSGGDFSKGTEKLIMNYDPNQIPTFSEPDQATLTGAVE